MSHITRVRTQLKDGIILRKALQRLGYHIKERDPRKSWAAEDLEFMAWKGSREIGFKRSEKSRGVYEMLADWEAMKGRRNDVLNAICQVYSQEKVMDLARAKGYSLMKNRVNENGQIEIVLRKVV